MWTPSRPIEKRPIWKQRWLKTPWIWAEIYRLLNAYWLTNVNILHVYMQKSWLNRSSERRMDPNVQETPGKDHVTPKHADIRVPLGFKTPNLKLRNTNWTINLSLFTFTETCLLPLVVSSIVALVVSKILCLWGLHAHSCVGYVPPSLKSLWSWPRNIIIEMVGLNGT
jgi:hypothetical protein